MRLALALIAVSVWAQAPKSQAPKSQAPKRLHPMVESVTAGVSAERIAATLQ